MKRIALWLLVLLSLWYLAGCSEKEKPAPAKMTRVSATKAYETSFGPAPTTDKGTCYAFVIYFPSAKEPGKVLPFPFFSFDQASLKKVAVQRLVAGLGDIKSYDGEILQPFPQGTYLLGLTESDGVVTVNFSSHLLSVGADENRDKALVHALVLTLAQFEVKEVRVQVEGKGSRLDRLVKPADNAWVLPLPPPRLLNVTAMKDKGAKEVDEVDAFFDRPVEIKTLQIAGADGKPFPGDIYQSVFDMSGVLKPKERSGYSAGMPVKVRWDVTDKMGRHSAGETEVALEVREH